MDAVRTARDFVVDRFPDAPAAVLGGSAGTERRTPLSDLDIVVFLSGPPAPFRETTEHDGWVVELFCHTVESYTSFVERETAARRSPLLHMCGEGVLLLDQHGLGRRLREEAAARLQAGPPPLSATELEDRRYLITDLLDDLVGSADHEESIFIANRLLTAVGELILAMRRCWQSHGKWLLRRLRAADPQTCEDLVAGYRHLVCEGDATVLHQVAASVLDRAGGRLLSGYRREAPAQHSVTLFREAGPGDFQSVLRLYRQLNAEDPVLRDGSDAAAFARILGSPELHLFVLEVDGAVVATAYLNVIPNLTRSASPYAVIENVVVDKALRGTGLGKQLMAETLRTAWDAGCYKAMLLTGSRLPATHAFYTACGFSSDAKTAFLARPGSART